MSGECSYIIKVLEKLSELYKMNIQDIASITTENSKTVFGIELWTSRTAF